MATDNTFYIDTTLFSTATKICTDPALTVLGVAGYYQAPVEGVATYRYWDGVSVLAAAVNCECKIIQLLDYNTTPNTLCCISETPDTYYIDEGTTFDTTTGLYTDASGQTAAPDNTYQVNGTTSYRIQSGGVLGSVNACPTCPVTCGGTIAGSGGQGFYNLEVNMGNTAGDVGAIVIYFNPRNVPDGIIALFDNQLYNKLSSITFGYLAGSDPFQGTSTGVATNKLIDSSATFTSTVNIGDKVVCVPDSTDAFVTVIDSNTQLTLSADIMDTSEIYRIGQATYIGNLPSDCSTQGTTFVLNTSNYTGGTFPTPSAPTVTVLPGASQINYTNGSPSYSTMVIPKTTATPQLLELNFIGPCNSTVFDINVSCPVSLPSFTSNTVESTSSGACSATQDQTYYFAQSYLNSNATPILHNWVFEDNSGLTTLSAGFYKVGTDVIEVANGVVISKTACPAGNTQFDSGSIQTSSALACAGSSTNNYYHDGSGTLPVVNDTAWSDNGVTVLPVGFYKINSNNTYYQITNSSGLVGVVGAFLSGTSFSVSTSQGTSTAACGTPQSLNLYHNGAAALPVVNDIVYLDECMSSIVGNGYRLISTSGNGIYMQITSNNGIVAVIANCPAGNTQFPSAGVQSTSALACASTVSQTYYHDGSGTLPSVGDTAWSDNGVTVLPNGAYKLNATSFYQITSGNGTVAGPSSFVFGTSWTGSVSAADATAACALSTVATTYTHDNVSGDPIVNDTCYTDACKVNVLADGVYKTTNSTAITISGGAGNVATVTTCVTYYSFAVHQVANPTLACSYSGTLDETIYTTVGTGPGAGVIIYSDQSGTAVSSGVYVYQVAGTNTYFATLNNGAVDSNGVQSCP
jgi:hypothetical protein